MAMEHNVGIEECTSMAKGAVATSKQKMKCPDYKDFKIYPACMVLSPQSTMHEAVIGRVVATLKGHESPG